MDILKDYKVSILSGHTHIHSNLKLRSNVREHMIASIVNIHMTEHQWGIKYLNQLL